jgi:transposase
MSRDVYFHQHCPVCGRMLQVKVSLLGRRVYCQHCGGGFTAMDEQLQPADGRSCRTAADRADELLRRAALMLAEASDNSAAGG